MKRLSVLTLLLLYTLTGLSQETPLSSGWKARKASEVSHDGYQLTAEEPDLTGWLNATVPGTVLTTLLNNGLVPDPWFGMNNEEIPDVWDKGRDYYTYWYFVLFSTEGIDKEKQVWLNFRGINYRTEIFLNGKRLGDSIYEGMFVHHKFNVTALLDESGHNRLAVRVEPPLHPGNPNGGQGGDGTIGRDVTMQFSAGWDWTAPVRDRNTGIWDEVTVEVTGSIDIRHSFAKTRVPGERLPGELQAPAYVTFSTDLVNPTDELVEGSIVLSYMGATEKKKIKVLPRSTVSFSFSEKRQSSPKIWWPNGMGQPSLYTAVITFHDKKGNTLDREDLLFGYRETGSYFDDSLGARVFTVNGQKLFIRGGNWIASDGMLRLSKARYDAEIKMHAEMNMNMIRVWGGALMERPAFYEACDRNGILVWQDLWITGDCNGRWDDPMKAEGQQERRRYPDNHQLFLQSVEDQVKLLRNHPSLYIICGGNEFPPPAGLDTLIPARLEEIDGTRIYLEESTSPELLRNSVGGNGDGPYTIQDPLWFFTEKWYPFNPEIGSVGMPNIEGLRRMMDEKDVVIPTGNEVPDVWRYHKYMGYGGMIEELGEPHDLDDWVRKAQLLNYEQYRSLVEAYSLRMWDWYSGFLLWKTQNPWPALRGQLYDWHLDQNAGFYGFRKAAEPLHLIFNPADSSIYLINIAPRERKGLRAEAELTDEYGRVVWQERDELVAGENRVTKLWDLKVPSTTAPVHFLRLRITWLSTGLILDESSYWLPSKGERKNLITLPKTKVVGQTMKSSGGRHSVDISNSGETAAFFVRMKVVRATDGEMVMPVFIDDNYIVLLPGEKRSIQVDVTSVPEEERNVPLFLHLEAFNLEPVLIRL